MWLPAEDWQVIIYRFMHRWINIWLNVEEHVLIKHAGMMSWLFPALELKKCNTMQSIFITINRLVIMCNEWCWLVWLILAVCAVTIFTSVKRSFAASTKLCGATRCATARDQVQQSLWGSRTSHIHWIWTGGMTRRIISKFRLAEPAIAMWARKGTSRLKTSPPYCSLVVGTPDVQRKSIECWRKTWRLQGETTTEVMFLCLNQSFTMLTTIPESGKGAEPEHCDSTLSISEHERRQNHPRQLSTIGQQLRLSGTKKTVTIIERYNPGSSHHPSSINEQKINSSKEFERPCDSPEYLVKTSKRWIFHVFEKTPSVIECPKFIHLQL